MWIKVILVAIYLLLVIVLTRFVDIAIRAYQLESLSLLPPHSIVDPLILSVKQLKSILDFRGVSYVGLVEKNEFRQLVDSSGHLSEDELSQISDNDNSQLLEKEAENDDEITSETVFTCGTHFYEQVEDTKDSAWLILVKPQNSDSFSFVKSLQWKQIIMKSSNFGIRTGFLDCALDPMFCEAKNWNTWRLLLALPREGVKTKEDVVLTSFVIGISTKSSQIMNWIHLQLATRIKKINSLTEMNSNWLSFGKNETKQEVKFVLLSTLATSPLIFSALAVKFSGRIKFGLFKVDEKSKKQLILKLGKQRLPQYIISTPDQIYVYGNKPGEGLNFKQMETLLRSLKPEINDVFLVSLLLVNLSLGLHFFWLKCSKVWKHVIFWFISLVKYNCILFLIWLTLLTLYKFPLMDNVTEAGLRVCQWVAFSSFASFVRYDFIYYYNICTFAITFFGFGVCLIILRRFVWFSEADNDDGFLLQDWAPWESTILSYVLFRPMGMSLSRPVPSSIDANLEEGMELLIERLATPNLWLQAELIADGYIKDLPCWSYQSDTETDEKDDETQFESTSSDVSGVSDLHSRKSNASHLNVASNENSDINSKFCSNISEASSLTSSQSVNCSNCSPNTSSNRRTEIKLPVKRDNSQRDSSTDRVPDGMLICKECAICLELYKRGQLICGLPCGHNYHENCIMSWLFRDNHCCPKCRWPTYKQKRKVN